MLNLFWYICVSFLPLRWHGSHSSYINNEEWPEYTGLSTKNICILFVSIQFQFHIIHLSVWHFQCFQKQHSLYTITIPFYSYEIHLKFIKRVCDRSYYKNVMATPKIWRINLFLFYSFCLFCFCFYFLCKLLRICMLARMIRYIHQSIVFGLSWCTPMRMPRKMGAKWFPWSTPEQHFCERLKSSLMRHARDKVSKSKGVAQEALIKALIWQLF